MGAIVKMSLAAESHPDARDVIGPFHWTFSPECLDHMAQQAVGLPVTVNFDGEPVGRVVAAEREPNRLILTIDADVDLAGRIASPEFVSTEDAWNEDYSDRVIRMADLTSIGLTDD